MIAPQRELEALLNGQHGQPHSLLGMHPITHQDRRGLAVRAFLQDARTCEVVDCQTSPDGDIRWRNSRRWAFSRPSSTSGQKSFAIGCEWKRPMVKSGSSTTPTVPFQR